MYVPGETCNLEATANTGYYFVNWTDAFGGGAVACVTPTFSFVVADHDYSYIANFTTEHSNITATSDNATFGTVSGGGDYGVGATCTLRATVNPGYYFIKWTEGGTEVSADAEYSFVVGTTDRNLVAHFSTGAAKTITVQPNPDPMYFGGTASGGGTFGQGENCTVTATPNEAYSFLKWTNAETGNFVSSEANYTFRVVDNLSLYANFAIKKHIVAQVADGSPTGCTVSGDGWFDLNATCTLVATPASGCHFVNWSDGEYVISTNPTYSFTVTGDRVLTAHFTSEAYTISASADPVAGGAITGTGTYGAGSTCTLTASPASGYYFYRWTKADNPSFESTEATISFVVDANATYVAHFENALFGGDDLCGEYTFTSSGTGNRFTVTHGGSSLGEFAAMGSITVRDCDVTFHFENTNTIYFNNDITVLDHTLTMECSSATADVVLQKADGNMGTIKVKKNSESTASLTINGSSTKQFVIAGCLDELVIEKVGDSYQPATIPSVSDQTNSLMEFNGGDVTMNYVTLKNNWSTGYGGAIYMVQRDGDGYVFNVTLANCVIENCTAENGGAVVMYSKPEVGYSAVNMNYCTVTNCLTRAKVDVDGTISTDGGANGLYINGGSIRDNYTNGGGGGINWNTYSPLTVTGGCHIENNHARVNGGGLEIKGNATLEGYVVIQDNECGNHGGGIYVSAGSTGTVTIQNINIGQNGHPNKALSGHGGGIMMESGIVNIGGPKTVNETTTHTRGFIDYNEAGIHGGGIAVFGGTLDLYNKGLSVDHNKATSDGGGIYDNGGAVVYNNLTALSGDIDSEIRYNEAGGNGGGIYATSNVALDGVVVSNNAAQGDGGGLYAAGGAGATVTVSGGVFGQNTAGGNGGGIVASSNISITGGTIGSNGSDIAGNSAQNGGGLFVVSDGSITVTVNGGTITGNTATQNGGGVFTTSTMTLTAGTISYNNAGKDGGGVYANGGDVKVNGGEISYNEATKDGGGVFAGKAVELTAGTISHNTASHDGGGLYVFGGPVEFEGGTISGNEADFNGGGIYIYRYVTLNMKLAASVTGNHVPATGKGGGIYLDGQMNVGENANDALATHTLNVTGNYAGTVYSEAVRNNVFLPEDVEVFGESNEKRGRVITLLSDISGSYEEAGETKYYSNIGLSVEMGFRRVIYTVDNNVGSPAKEWLEKLIPTGVTQLNTSIFDDSRTYYALHVKNDAAFDSDYIYLYGCWPTVVTSDPQTGDHTLSSNEHYYLVDDVWHIKSNNGLAWFLSWVNGLNGQSVHSSAVAFIENDIDMSRYLWVPIGGTEGTVTGTGSNISFTDGGEFKGSFDGQGHVITGLRCNYVTGVYQYGLFGTVSGGEVKNTFVDDYDFRSYIQGSSSDKQYRMGGIAAEASGSAVLYGCEARGSMNSDDLETGATDNYMGGLVGKMGGTATIHSSMAMPEMRGNANHVGGLVGLVGESNTLKNCFSNMNIGTVASTTLIGGLVGVNNGTVENCYARLQNETTPSNFGWLAGTNNTDNIKYCYAPDGASVYQKAGTGVISNHGNYTATQRFGGKYGFKHRDQQMTPTSAQYISDVNNNSLNGGLLNTLNAWVDANSGYATWTRTMASTINDDYPVPMLTDFNNVGSKDNIYLLYEDNLNEQITLFNAVDAYTYPHAAIYLYKEENNAINIDNNANVLVVIQEDLGIKQVPNNKLKARVGVTIKNDREDGPNWHLFSSAIEDVPMGLVYHTDDASVLNAGQPYGTVIPNREKHPHSVWSDRTQFDPPKTTWSSTAIGYFPTNTPYGTWRSTHYLNSSDDPKGFFDLYCYSEEFYHWINFKREGSGIYRDHWHNDGDIDGDHVRLDYGYRIEDGTFVQGNEPTLLKGKGYLLDLSSESMLMADGKLNTGDVFTYVTNTPSGTNSPTNNGYDESWRTINMIGNPYQSYLDFDKFAIANTSSPEEAAGCMYATRDDRSANEEERYIYYLKGQSENPYTANQYIHPHQGFFVKVKSSGTLKFTDEMRVIEPPTPSPYRDKLNYPLVNLLCYDEEGNSDMATIEVNRPEFGGGQKMKELHSCKGLIYAHYESQSFQILFAPVGVNTVPIRFEAIEDGYFTLRWNTLHGDFSYIHLVDNLIGVDIDCLTTNEYTFEGRTTDYASRFKLIFDCTGVEESEDLDSFGESTSFAFQIGDELVVNGKGLLQLFDMNGRCLLSTQTVDMQTNIGIPEVAKGMYLLRLIDSKQVKVQKLIIE